MIKCLKITVLAHYSEGLLRTFIQKNACKLDLEGTAQAISPREIRIIACGIKDNIDTFLDILHKGSAQHTPDDIQVEPFLNKKDYRGVFRIIE